MSLRLSFYPLNRHLLVLLWFWLMGETAGESPQQKLVRGLGLIHHKIRGSEKHRSSRQIFSASACRCRLNHEREARYSHVSGTIVNPIRRVPPYVMRRIATDLGFGAVFPASPSAPGTPTLCTVPLVLLYSMYSGRKDSRKSARKRNLRRRAGARSC